MSARMHSNIKRQMQAIEQDVRKTLERLENMKRDFIWRTYDIMVEEAPERTGFLRMSIRIEQTPEGAKIGPTHVKAGPIEKGTRPSPGRYVPELGRRVKHGVHPGTPPKEFVDRTFRRIINYIDGRISEVRT